ncbi:peptidoglycan-binding protein [Phormidium yuhuli AB48]|uniref:Peptidoglycan-binding protein n=1 Tax=Phormidium yuhuli AB48 TaxID=2940671 RepID=A0ABY5AVR0_9CYAN|nr:peptidoglycan-binding protein [Phormidium yuhuli]USR92841.1 peptidoglycan-binding protein [Phormidium yuhuli AB48]
MKLLLNAPVISRRLSTIVMMAAVWGLAEPSWGRPQPQGDRYWVQQFPDLNLSRPLLRVGSRGSEVRELQAILQLMGFYRGPVNGEYGEQTARAVSAFQEAAGIDVDGVVGAQTWNRLFPPLPVGGVATPVYEPANRTPDWGVVSSNQQLPNPETGEGMVSASSLATPESRNLPLLSRGAEGSAVVELQLLLQDLGFYNGEIDGLYQGATITAVERFQSRSGLVVDGVVGPMTWNALLGY